MTKVITKAHPHVRVIPTRKTTVASCAVQQQDSVHQLPQNARNEARQHKWGLSLHELRQYY
jgi:hypothetical protein